ncbi:dienelactone hydrolase family protein [Streptomyces sp. NPDC004031]
MNSVQFTAETITADGLRERDFTVAGVPGVLWSPADNADNADSTGRAPLVLMGHGGGTHKKWPGMTGRAERLVRAGGFHVAVIDAPGHNGRPLSADDEREVAALRQAMTAGEPVGPIVVRHNARIAERAVPEWRATLDALQQLPEIGPDGPVGYFGLNMGTAIGIPLIADEPRITAAVLGMFWPDTVADTAARVTVPVQYALQWDDEHIPRAAGLALFDAIGSREKTLHANTGRHKEVPRFEADSAVAFFTRHLSRPAPVPVS